jgi:ubiquinone/menaquinone biosynthesis C-methylase UbiE
VQGSALGYAAIIEARGRSSGYLGVVQNLVNEAQLQPGEEIVEVGCGTGVITRWLAHQTKMANRITGIDINAYFIREARHLAAKDRLEHVTEFQVGNAVALPFPDNSFDVVLAFTVMEEVNANQMLAEMIRVTRPGGKVGVLVRSVDMPVFVNLPLRQTVKAKVEAPPIWWGGVSAEGCADVSLYKHFHAAGLTEVKMMPQLATYAEQERLQRLYPQFVPLLDPGEVDEWWTAVSQAEAEGTAFIAQPFHSAVGKKPKEVSSA